MRVIFLLLVSSIAFQSKSQTWNNYLQKRFKSYGIWADSILLVPNDTSLNKTGFAIIGTTAYIGDGTKWTAITGGSSVVDSLASIYTVDTFTANPTIIGTTFGKYPNGSTPVWVGLTAREAILDAILNCIPPTYLYPTTEITATYNTGGGGGSLGGSGTYNYEIGTNFGNVTPSYTSYNQRNGGTVDSSWIYHNGVHVSTPINIGNLETTQTFYARVFYGQGACINNNCGTLDCTGRIEAGNVNSPTLTLQPYYLKFFGAAAAVPSNSAQVRALANQSYYTTGTTVTLNTGTTYTDFIVALPQGKTITGVIDETALNANITSSYVLTGTISVNDAGGTARTYNLYQMTIGSPYAINHVHKITHN